jgi:hypothetical protein
MACPSATGTRSGPGAAGAVYNRLSIVRRVATYEKSRRADLPGPLQGKPDNAVFRALAIVRMTGLSHSGFPSQGFPLDVEELIRLIQKESAEPAP